MTSCYSTTINNTFITLFINVTSFYLFLREKHVFNEVLCTGNVGSATISVCYNPKIDSTITIQQILSKIRSKVVFFHFHLCRVPVSGQGLGLAMVNEAIPIISKSVAGRGSSHRQNGAETTAATTITTGTGPPQAKNSKFQHCCWPFFLFLPPSFSYDLFYIIESYVSRGDVIIQE